MDEPEEEEDAGFVPENSDIQFIARTGEHTRVHVMVPLIEGDQFIAGVDIGFFADFARTRTLCGRLLPWEEYHRVDTFDDDRTCRRCHRGMGEYSDRLFAHAVPRH